MATTDKEAPTGVSFADVSKRAEEHAGLDNLLTEQDKDVLFRNQTPLYAWAARIVDTGFGDGARRYRCEIYLTETKTKPATLQACKRFGYGWTAKRDGIVKAIREAAKKGDTPIGPIYLTKRDLAANDAGGRAMFAWVLSDTPDSGPVAVSAVNAPSATMDDDDIPF